MDRSILVLPSAYQEYVVTFKLNDDVTLKIDDVSLGAKSKTTQGVYVVVQFYPVGSNFIFLCFKLIIIHYHAQKQRRIKFEPRIKLNLNINISLEVKELREQ